ncbi:MAG TPA: sigma-70 family RNA polymerase sigma factor [Gemmataceae bacterium]
MATSSHAVLDYLRSFLSRQRGAEGDDRELLRRFAQTRDGDAFAALLRRHGPMVLGLARRVAGDWQTAEDVFQAAFLMLARKVHTIRRAESLPCWLHGVTFRLALRARRSQQRRQERETHVRRSPPPTPLDELTARELLEVLDEELQNLPENYRAPLILCCLEGLSQEEAAKRLNCSAGAVRGRLERGRNRLRLRLEKRGLTLPAVLGGTLLVADAVSATPPALMQSTLTAVTMGAGATPAATLLMQGAMRTIFLHKLKLVSAVVVLLGVTGGGLSMMALRPQAVEENEPPLAAVPDDKPVSGEKRVDLYGDPLPEGAEMRLGTIQRRAVGAQIAATPDGRSIVSVRGGKYVAIWDAATGRMRQRHELPVAAIDPMSFSELSPDGRWLATNRSAQQKSNVTIWDVRTGKKIRELLFTDARDIGLCAFSADGRRLAATGFVDKNCFVRIWNLSDGKCIFDKPVRAGSSERLTFTPDGKHLLASFDSWEGALHCWEVESGRQLWQSKEFEPCPIVVTPDSKVLAWRQHESPALDLATGRLSKVRLPSNAWKCSQLTFSPDGCTLLLSRLGDLIVWDYQKGQQRRVLKGAGEQAVFLPDGKSVITNNGSLQRWELASGQTVWPDTFARGHVGEVVTLAFSADGRRLVSGSRDGSVRWWDVTTGRPLHIWDGHKRPTGLPDGPQAPSGVTALDLTPDGGQLLSAGWGGTLQFHDLRTGERLHSLSLPSDDLLEGPPYAYHLRMSRLGTRAVGLVGAEFFRNIVGHEHDKRTHRLATWDLKTGRLRTCRSVPVNASVLSPDGRAVLLANGVLLDAETGKEIARMQEMTERYPHVFSPDGALIVGGSELITREKDGLTARYDGVRVWEAATGKPVAHIKRKFWPAQADFHPDGRFVVLNDHDGVQIWDLFRGTAVAGRKMPEQVCAGASSFPRYASCLAVTRNGRRMATGMPDGTILLWDVKLPPPVREALTAKERESLWADLANDDAAKAWHAVWRMAEVPQDALTFLRGRVKPYPTAPADVTRKLLADLEDSSFERRETAGKQLKELGLQAEPALRAALNAKPSLEQRRRIESLLAALAETPQSLSAEDLRQLRAVIVLERIDSPEARRLLEDVATGPESATLTRQARAARACLR